MLFQYLSRQRRDRGFSFIELLAYMAIAALLILAAVPQFSAYRERALISNLQNDVRNAALAAEAALYPTAAAKGSGGSIRLASTAESGTSQSSAARVVAAVAATKVSNPGTTLSTSVDADDAYTITGANPGTVKRALWSSELDREAGYEAGLNMLDGDEAGAPGQGGAPSVPVDPTAATSCSFPLPAPSGFFGVAESAGLVFASGTNTLYSHALACDDKPYDTVLANPALGSNPKVLDPTSDGKTVYFQQGSSGSGILVNGGKVTPFAPSGVDALHRPNLADDGSFWSKMTSPSKVAHSANALAGAPTVAISPMLNAQKVAVSPSGKTAIVTGSMPYIAGSTSNAAITTDAGATWTRANVPNVSGQDLHISDDGKTIAFWGGSSSWVVNVSRDGGATWKDYRHTNAITSLTMAASSGTVMIHDANTALVSTAEAPEWTKVAGLDPKLQYIRFQLTSDGHTFIGAATATPGTFRTIIGKM